MTVVRVVLLEVFGTLAMPETRRRCQARREMEQYSVRCKIDLRDRLSARRRWLRAGV